MNSVRAGDVVEIRLHDLSEPGQKADSAYAVIISANAINDHLSTVIVCPLMDAKEVKKSRMGATFLPKDIVGIEKDSIAFSLQIKTVSKNRILKRINSLPTDYIQQIRESLHAVLDFS